VIITAEAREQLVDYAVDFSVEGIPVGAPREVNKENYVTPLVE
jgi:hypothetical protein